MLTLYIKLLDCHTTLHGTVILVFTVAYCVPTEYNMRIPVRKAMCIGAPVSQIKTK